MLRVWRCHQWAQQRRYFSVRTDSHLFDPFAHWTQAQLAKYFEYQDKKPPRPVVQKALAPQFLRPLMYHPGSSRWVIALESHNGRRLEKGRVLKVVSWNIDWSSAGAEARATAALEYLEGLFGELQDPFVVMFQEVCGESLQAILENPWVQRNFFLSNIEAPESRYTHIPGDSFVMKCLDWRAVSYFPFLMISRNLAIESCFRVPFVTMMGREALVVDIPLFSSREQTEPKECFRLCTTHLESLWLGAGHRPGQLGLISTLLKGATTIKSRIVAGVVGGDMNAVNRSEHDLHRAIDVDLQDAWEDVPAPPIPVLKQFQKDFSYGRARGNTWGYHSKQSRTRKRMDKFLYTGSLQTVALDEAQDVTGKLGRLGIGLKTEVDAWEEETMRLIKVRGMYVEKPHKEYYSQRQAAKLRELPGRRELVHTRLNTWVSDHFGIAIGIKVLEERLPTP